MNSYHDSFSSPSSTPDFHNDKIDSLGAAFYDLRQEWDTQKTQDTHLVEKMHKVESALDHHHTLIQKMQTVFSRPALDATTLSPSEPASHPFHTYIRQGIEPWESKSLNASAPAEGGFLVPQVLSQRIHTLLKEESFFRTIARVTSISNDALDLLVDKGHSTVGWAKEQDKRDETSTPELVKIRIPVHELYARPKATQQLLEDAYVNVEEWLIEKIATQMAETENDAFINGDGDGKPYGFLNYGRSHDFEWGKFQSLKTGVKGGFSNAYPENHLIDLFHLLKPAYLKDAVWVMSRSMQSAVRKLKDPTTDHYLWQPTLSQTMLPTLMGFPVYVTDHMPPLEAGQNGASIAFGNFKEGYHIVDRHHFHILRDPYSAKPYVEFYTTKRVGGDVINFEAIKVLDFIE